MSSHLKSLALVVVMLLATLGATDPALAADGSVRFLSAGPVRLGDGHIGHMRVFLPVIQRPVPIHFLGEGGAVLKTVTVDPPERGAGPFFEVFFEVSFDKLAGQQGTLTITDGTSNTILTHPSTNGIIAILIGLRGAGGMGTLQVDDAQGQPLLILPYIEQDNLLRR